MTLAVGGTGAAHWIGIADGIAEPLFTFGMAWIGIAWVAAATTTVIATGRASAIRSGAGTATGAERFAAPGCVSIGQPDRDICTAAAEDDRPAVSVPDDIDQIRTKIVQRDGEVEGIANAVAVEVAVKRGEVRAFLAHVGENDVDVGLRRRTINCYLRPDSEACQPKYWQSAL
jgi:hypothetical protein